MPSLYFIVQDPFIRTAGLFFFFFYWNKQVLLEMSLKEDRKHDLMQVQAHNFSSVAVFLDWSVMSRLY